MFNFQTKNRKEMTNWILKLNEMKIWQVVSIIFWGLLLEYWYPVYLYVIKNLWFTDHDICALTVTGEKPQRRGSVGSLDSGMSISFQSTSASSMSQGAKHPGQMMHLGMGPNKALATQQPSFLGSLFNKRERKLSQSDDSNSPYSRSTDV